MTTPTYLPELPAGTPEPSPRAISERRGRGDKSFSGLTYTSGVVVLGIMLAVGVFLATQATDALRITGLSFFTTQPWQPAQGEYGILAVLGFTIAIAIIAVLIAIPVALGAALFITEIAPPRIRGSLVALVDLMAAVPSVVYGLWGAFLLQEHIVDLSRWLNTWFGWIPFLDVGSGDPDDPLSSLTVYSASTFIAGIVVSMMVIPIQASVMREVFSQVPISEREGAYALGSTRWGMIRVVSLPFGRGGIIGGTMLGLGRALGETIAVVLIISPRFDFTVNVLESGSNSISSLIALRYAEASDLELSALFAAGLTLFVITLLVNFTASYFVARSRSGAASEA